MQDEADNTKARLAYVLFAALTLGLCSCQSLDQLAPPVASISARPSGPLALGREIYVTKCTKCHSPEPVLKYSAAEWEKIVPDMAEESKLTERQTAAVRDYVMAVLANAAASGAPLRNL